MKHATAIFVLASFVHVLFAQNWQSICALGLAVGLYGFDFYLSHKKQETELSAVLKSLKALEQKNIEYDRILSTSSLGQAFRPSSRK